MGFSSGFGCLKINMNHLRLFFYIIAITYVIMSIPVIYLFWLFVFNKPLIVIPIIFMAIIPHLLLICSFLINKKNDEFKRKFYIISIVINLIFLIAAIYFLFAIPKNITIM